MERFDVKNIMKSIIKKIETFRTATAQSVIQAKAETLLRLVNNDVPKKDILPIARAAAVMAVKKTPELLPYCHPVPIDFVGVEYEIKDNTITILCSVEAVAKTGLEMEALTGASVAALTIYDMLKPIDVDIEILNTKLLKKKGGKSSFIEKIPSGFKAAVIVTSDSTSQGKRSDKSGRLIEDRLKSFGVQSTYLVIPDDKDLIAQSMRDFCDKGFHLIMSTGGTGLGPRDVTVEAASTVIDREIPGIMEAARNFGQRRTPYAMLSRGLAGQKGKTLIVNLPGSSKGVEESLDAIFPGLFHAYGMMKGDGHDA